MGSFAAYLDQMMNDATNSAVDETTSEGFGNIRGTEKIFPLSDDYASKLMRARYEEIAKIDEIITFHQQHKAPLDQRDLRGDDLREDLIKIVRSAYRIPIGRDSRGDTMKFSKLVGGVKANLEVGAEVLPEVSCISYKRPLFRKEFNVDESQLWYSGTKGPDSVLAITDIFPEIDIKHMSKFCKAFGPTILVEARKCHVYGEAGRYADAGKHEKIRSGGADVISVNDLEHLLSLGVPLNSMDTTMRAGGKIVYGKAGRYTDAGKYEKVRSGGADVISMNDFEHILSLGIQLNSMDTTMRSRGQIVENCWFMDSGATIHVCDSRAKFLEYTAGSGGIHVVVANNSHVEVAGIGTVLLMLSSGESVILKDVLHVPTINKCLISVSRLNQDGFGVNFEAQKAVIYKNGRSIGEAYNKSGMFSLDINNGPTGPSTSGTVSEAPKGFLSFLKQMLSYFKGAFGTSGSGGIWWNWNGQCQ